MTTVKRLEQAKKDLETFRSKAGQLAEEKQNLVRELEARRRAIGEAVVAEGDVAKAEAEYTKTLTRIATLTAGQEAVQVRIQSGEEAVRRAERELAEAKVAALKKEADTTFEKTKRDLEALIADAQALARTSQEAMSLMQHHGFSVNWEHDANYWDYMARTLETALADLRRVGLQAVLV